MWRTGLSGVLDKKERSATIVTLRLWSYLCGIKNVHGDLGSQRGWKAMWPLSWHSITILFLNTTDKNRFPPHPTPSLPLRKHTRSSSWKGSLKIVLAQSEPKMAPENLPLVRSHPLPDFRNPKSWQTSFYSKEGCWTYSLVRQGFHNKNFLVCFKSIPKTENSKFIQEKGQ